MIAREKTSPEPFGDFAKVVVDIERKILAIGCELHIDCAKELMEDGSSGKNLWGANLYPEEKRIDYVSLINIRPKENNRSMEVKNQEIREKMKEVIHILLDL